MLRAVVKGQARERAGVAATRAQGTCAHEIMHNGGLTFVCVPEGETHMCTGARSKCSLRGVGRDDRVAVIVP